MKLWTEKMVPERVRKVPKMVRAKVEMISTRFQAWSMPRRRCTTAEWRKAVPISHGKMAAFSTGSHAQYPPQPSTSYDHQPPRMTPKVRNVQATTDQRWVRSSHTLPWSPRHIADIAKAYGIVNPTYPT